MKRCVFSFPTFLMIFILILTLLQSSTSQITYLSNSSISSSNCSLNRTYPSFVNASDKISRLYHYLLFKEPYSNCKTWTPPVASPTKTASGPPLSVISTGASNGKILRPPPLFVKSTNRTDNPDKGIIKVDEDTEDMNEDGKKVMDDTDKGFQNAVESKTSQGILPPKATNDPIIDIDKSKVISTEERITFENKPNPKIFTGRDWYISSSKGSSSGDGTVVKPLSDLDKALKSAKTGDKFYLRCGDSFSGIFSINVDKIWVGSYSDDGTKSKPVITRARKVLEKVSSQGKISIYNVGHLMGSYPAIWCIWIHGFRYVIARYPNLQDIKEKRGVATSEFLFLRAPSSNKEIKPPSNLKNLQNPNYWKGATIRIRKNHWAYNRAKVVSVNPGASSLTLNTVVQLEYSSGFFLENIQQELDAPGEYWYDQRQKRLHIYECPTSQCPSSGDKGDEGIWILPLHESCQEWESRACGRVEEDYKIRGDPSRPSILAIRGDQVELHGLKLNKGYTGLEIYGKRIQIYECEFDLMMESAIHAYTTGSVIVKSSLFQNIEIDGISNENEKDGPPKVPGLAILVDDCVFKNIAMVAGYNYQGFGVTCYHCEVKNSQFQRMGYGAIQFWGHGYIHDNTIRDWQMTLCDTGAIYSVFHKGKSRVEKNKVLGTNYWNGLSTNHGRGSGSGAGIYLDQKSSDTTVSNNLIDATTLFCFRINSSRNIQIKSNQCKMGGIWIQNLPQYGIPKDIAVESNEFVRTKQYIVKLDSQTNLAIIPELVRDFKNNKFYKLHNCNQNKDFKIENEFARLKSQNALVCNR